MLIKHLRYCHKEIAGIKIYGSFVLTGTMSEFIDSTKGFTPSSKRFLGALLKRLKMRRRFQLCGCVVRGILLHAHTHTYLFVSMSGRAMETGVKQISRP